MLPPPQSSQLQGFLYKWTDDLPQCKQSGVGYQTNLVYRAGGGMGAVTEYEDRSFYFACPGECFLYGILDGHDGPMVADFAGQRLPAELILGQIQDEDKDREVKMRLKEAFENVSKGFLEDVINEPLMEKMNLEEQVPLDMNPKDAYKRFPSLFQHLEQLEKRIKGGCSAVIALIHKSRLFVANVGDARALLCRIDPNNEEELGTVQLSTDHTISTLSELQRLANLGVDIEKLQQLPNLLKTTRSLGDWPLKGGYTSHAILKTASDEPVLSAPSVHGGEDISTPSRKFLILMSRGLYTAYEQATDAPRDQVNHDIAHMVLEEIYRQTTIEGVAQSVVDRICRLHKEQFTESQNQKCLRRDDMTLLIRLFNIKVGERRKPTNNAATPTSVNNRHQRQQRPQLAPLKMPEKPVTPPRSTSPPSTESSTPSTATPGSAGSSTTSPQWAPSESPLTVTFTEQGQIPAIPPRIPQQATAQPAQQPSVPARPEQKTEAKQVEPPVEQPVFSDDEDKSKMFNRPPEPLDTDEDGRIKAYVSFDEFNERVLAAGGEAVVFAEFLR